MIFITTMDPYAGKVFAGIILKYLVSILFFLAVIAVIIINYTKSSKCYKCGSRKLLLINSPKGKELLRQYYPEKFKLIEELGGKYICCECGEILKSSKKFYVTFINATLITCSVVLVIFLGFMQRSHILLWNSWDFNHGYFNTGFDNLLHEVIFEILNNLVPMGIISHAGGNELIIFILISVLFIITVIKMILVYKKNKCPKCSCAKTLPINSPKGKELLKRYYPGKFKLIEEMKV